MFFLVSFVSSLAVQRHEEKSFLQFMRENGMFYTGDEYSFRLGVFLANLRYIREFNAKQTSFRLSVNRFAAYTPEEYRSLLGHRPTVTDNSEQTATVDPNDDYPDELDWRDEGVVQPVEDQGKCGADWAFAAVSCMESHWAIIHETLYSLSAQDLLDCVNSCWGCEGGTVRMAWRFVCQEQGGAYNLKEDYPYTGVKGTCQFNSSEHVLKQTWSLVLVGNEPTLRGGLARYGPITVAIDGSLSSFQFYSSGIYDEPSCSKTELNHAMVAVGYGIEDDVDYWIVRNSWGVSWGEEGYIRMVRNKSNQCGVATELLYPLIY